MSAYTMVRGSMARFTRVDPCGGEPLGGYSVSTKGIVEIQLNPRIYSRDGGETVTPSGDLRLVHNAAQTVVGWTADISLVGVDPDVLAITTGSTVLRNGSNQAVGFLADALLESQRPTFSLEVWSRLTGGQSCPSGRWGLTTLHKVSGGVLGDVSFQNGAVNASIKGATCRKTVGGGPPSFWSNRTVEVAPPAPGRTVPSP